MRPGDVVLLSSSPCAAPLVRSIYRRVLEAGGHPHLRVSLDGAAETLLKEGNEAQLEWMNPATIEDVERADVRIAIEADLNTRSLSGIDPARQARFARSREALRDRYFERTAAGELRSVVTLFPTSAAAQDAEMSLAEYEDFVFHAGLLDRDDPVGEWHALGESLRRLGAWLGGMRELRVVAE